MSLSRRRVLAVLASASLAGPVRAQSRPTMLVHKDPNCGCCGEWVKHVRAAGFTVTVIETRDLRAVKTRRRVPPALESCHTAEIDGYVIEGHVPPAEIVRLLAERPHAIGLAVPDMPVGSPGMEVAGVEPETYEVILFGAGESTYARYRGAQRI